jgi:hypothetical protein
VVKCGQIIAFYFFRECVVDALRYSASARPTAAALNQRIRYVFMLLYVCVCVTCVYAVRRFSRLQVCCCGCRKGELESTYRVIGFLSFCINQLYWHLEFDHSESEPESSATGCLGAPPRRREAAAAAVAAAASAAMLAVAAR